MTCKYDKIYLEGVMDSLGAMMDYGVNSLHLTPAEMFSKFISSGIAGYIEHGHPRYLAGLSGVELALIATGMEPDGDFVYPGEEYWAGWALAYLQWQTGRPFGSLALCGMDIDTVLGMYHPYHEADITKFALDASRIIERNLAARGSRLKAVRRAVGLTQQELSALSGVPLRTIRSYEQLSRSLQRAEAGTLQDLSRALGCPAQALLL